MNKKLLVLTLLLALVLSSCSKEKAPTEEKSVQEIYTAVALTALAQVTNTPVPTATTRPTDTPAPSPSPTQTAAAASPTTQASVAPPVVSYCDNSAYVSDVTIPDGKIIYPGESFTKTWLIKNTGTCTWNKSYAIAFVSGDAMSGKTTTLAASTGPGEQLEVSVAMIAPSTAGNYTGYWKLQNATGSSFGQAVYVQIAVSLNASTITPTSTVSSFTSTPTSTTAAATSTLTSTPTETSEP